MPFRITEFIGWDAVCRASAFLSAQGVRHALGGGAALVAGGMPTGGQVRDVDFLVEVAPTIPPWVKVMGGGPSADAGGGIESDDGGGIDPNHPTRPISVDIAGLKVDFIPVGSHYGGGVSHEAEERGWLARADLFDAAVEWFPSRVPLGGGRIYESRALAVPVMRFVDALRWKWLAGRDKDLALLASASYGTARRWTDEELAAMREMSQAAQAAQKLQRQRASWVVDS